MIDLAEIFRQLHAMSSVGTVTTVDPQRGCRVRVGERETGWLKVPGFVGRNYRASMPLREGTQVLLLCPSGNPANAIIVAILYSDSLAPPSSEPDQDVILFNDGTKLTYFSGQKVLEIDTVGEIRIKAAGAIILEAGGDLTLKAAGEIRVVAGGELHLDGSAIRALEGG